MGCLLWLLCCAKSYIKPHYNDTRLYIYIYISIYIYIYILLQYMNVFHRVWINNDIIQARCWWTLSCMILHHQAPLILPMNEQYDAWKVKLPRHAIRGIALWIIKDLSHVLSHGVNSHKSPRISCKAANIWESITQYTGGLFLSFTIINY